MAGFGCTARLESDMQAYLEGMMKSKRVVPGVCQETGCACPALRRWQSAVSSGTAATPESSAGRVDCRGAARENGRGSIIETGRFPKAGLRSRQSGGQGDSAAPEVLTVASRAQGSVGLTRACHFGKNSQIRTELYRRAQLPGAHCQRVAHRLHLPQRLPTMATLF